MPLAAKLRLLELSRLEIVLEVDNQISRSESSWRGFGFPISMTKKNEDSTGNVQVSTPCQQSVFSSYKAETHSRSNIMSSFRCDMNLMSEHVG